MASPVYATPYVPQRLGTIFGGRANTNVADIMKAAQAQANTQAGMLKELEAQKLKNRVNIMKLDVQIKALNTSLEQFKQIDQDKFNEALSERVILMEKYQELNYEQTLLNAEIDNLKSSEPVYQNNSNSINYPMSDPLLPNQKAKGQKTEAKQELFQAQRIHVNKKHQQEKKECCTNAEAFCMCLLCLCKVLEACN